MEPAGYNLGVYGISHASPFQVSEVLKALGISHTVVGHNNQFLDITVAREQPATVYVVDSFPHLRYILKRPQEYPYLVFVVTAEDELKQTNAKILQSVNLKGVLKCALKESHPKKATPFLFHYSNKPLDDYVNEATKPTFLYFIQTAIYKLSPYELVKESRNLIISALYGAIPMKKLHDFLSTSFKLEELKTLLKDDRAKQVRDIVLEVRRLMHVHKDLTGIQYARKEDAVVKSVVKSSNLEPFDILYVMRSYQKMERDRISGKKRGRPSKKEASKKGR